MNKENLRNEPLILVAIGLVICLCAPMYPERYADELMKIGGSLVGGALVAKIYQQPNKDK